ncbi:hypothetical protein HDV03_000155 [Kappamyces sp. JEL0829]|nr:hypothetical protein HDV03_000155 [Kappamyces sp. JEL0829]
MEQAKLNKAAGTFGSLVRAIPLGTMSIMLLATVIFIINLFDGWQANRSLCLASTNTTNALFSHLLSLLGNQLTHDSVWHQVIAVLMFPFVAAGVEVELGTFQFLWVFFSTGMVTSFLYVFVVWVFSFAFPSWGYSCVGGLDIAFFTFLMIEALNGRGLYELSGRFGLASVPRELFFIPFFILLAVVLPFNSWYAHLIGAAVGTLFYLGLFDVILLPDAAINALETAGILSWYYSRSNFLVKPGAVQLPMPGSFRPDGPPDNHASFITQVTNALRPQQDQYAPIASYQGLERQPDPLTWEEGDETAEGGSLLAKPQK